MLHGQHLLVMALAGAALRSAPAVAQGDARAVDQVAALVVRYDSAWNRKDTAAVGTLMAPQYQYFNSLGGVRSRAPVLEFLRSPDYRLDHARRSEVRVTHAGPVAVVSSRWQGSGVYQGRRFVDDQRCGMVWVQSAAAWQVVSEHCVQIVPDPWAGPE